MFKKVFKRITALTVTAVIGISLVPTSFKVDAASKIGWNHDDNGWWYKNSDGSYLKSEWKFIKSNWYYFNSDGYMAHNEYRDGYWLGGDGRMSKKYKHGTWKSNDTGTWYQDGSWYPKNQIVWINGEGYYFGERGYLYSDEFVKGIYVNTDGTASTMYNEGRWIHCDKGWKYWNYGWILKDGWYKINGSYYYFKSDGYLADNEYIDGQYYKNGCKDYLYSDGQWIQNDKGWYYLDGDWYPKDMGLWIDDKYYFFDSLGYYDRDATNNAYENTSKDDLVIVIDPGHEDDDGKRIFYGTNKDYGITNETNICLNIAKSLKKQLEQYDNVRVYMTRETNNVSIELNERCEIGFRHDADLLVSIHLNASASGYTASGTEVWYPNENYRYSIYEEGRGVANSIQSQLVSLGLSDRGAKTRTNKSYPIYGDGSLGDYYAIQRHSKLFGFPGLIVEHCFLDNKAEYDAYLSSQAKLDKQASAVCKGIVDYYGLELK